MPGEHIRKALAEAEVLKADVAAMKAERDLENFKKVAKECDMPESDAAVLQKAYRGDKESVDKLLAMIKAAHAQVRAAGLFKEVGASGPGISDDPLEMLKAKADEIRKADGKLTKEQAFVKAMEMYPEIARAERELNRPRAA